MKMATLSDQPVRRASQLKLATMGFLTFWMPYVFVWFIQDPKYPATFRRSLTAWAILSCSCAVLFFVVSLETGDLSSH